MVTEAGAHIEDTEKDFKLIQTSITNDRVFIAPVLIGVLTIPLKDGSYLLIELNEKTEEVEVLWRPTSQPDSCKVMFKAPVNVITIPRES